MNKIAGIIYILLFCAALYTLWWNIGIYHRLQEIKAEADLFYER